MLYLLKSFLITDVLSWLCCTLASDSDLDGDAKTINGLWPVGVMAASLQWDKQAEQIISRIDLTEVRNLLYWNCAFEQVALHCPQFFIISVAQLWWHVLDKIHHDPIRLGLQQFSNKFHNTHSTDLWILLMSGIVMPLKLAGLLRGTTLATGASTSNSPSSIMFPGTVWVVQLT